MATPLFIRSAPPASRRKVKEVPERNTLFARHMQRPPTIMPNYGKKTTKIGVPKTSLSRVLLYDNITQQQMLDVKIAHIKIEKQRAEHLFNMHRRAFNAQMEKRHPHLRKKKSKPVKHQVPSKLDLKRMSLPLPRIPSVESKSTDMTSSSMTAAMMRRFSTFSLNDVRLPDIGQHEKQILLKLKTQSGRRKLYHSYDESGIFVDLVPLYSFYPDIKDDPRFQKLQTSLISPIQEETVGYEKLSPSYETQYPRIPTFLREQTRADNE